MRSGIRILAALCAAFTVPYVLFSSTVKPPADDSSSVQTTLTASRYTLRDYNGMLAVFVDDSSIPLETFPILTASLPAAEAERIRIGIDADTREELQLLLEDYTS